MEQFYDTKCKIDELLNINKMRRGQCELHILLYHHLITKKQTPASLCMKSSIVYSLFISLILEQKLYLNEALEEALDKIPNIIQEQNWTMDLKMLL